ncbi:MAG: NADH-quinone oxidoreductase subunit D, partial [Armatimonadetes bacterium]|nr:NADH-quinone oxidoreductase subunit D [Armatimonadota bacterium]
ELRTETMTVNMGPQHPSTHGVLRLVVTLDGENIVDVQPDIGYLHSSVEKMMEYRTYLQNIALVDRGMDYLSAMANEEVWCLATERLAKIEAPERARYIRTIMLELQRISSHLIWLGTFGIDLGAFTAFLWAMRERERIMDLFESATGGRLHHVYFRIGGVYEDLPDGWTDRCATFCDYFMDRLPEYDELLTGNPIFLARTQGVGVLPTAKAIAMGASGPVARASGLAYDVRRAHPYEVYDRLQFDIPVRTEGDCFARYLVRLEEMRQSIRIIRQCLETIPQGEIRAKVAVTLRVPKGEVYARTESPRGDLGIYLISEGKDMPYRVKIRAPAFSNLYALTEMMRGWKVADVIAILGSIDIVLSDVDR